MTGKLVNIKNLLRIIISCFVIVNMARSCAKALSYDEILDYVTRTAEYYSNNSKYQTIKNQIATVAFKNAISQYASNYDSVYLFWVSGGSYQPATVHCYMFTDNDGILTGNSTLYCNGPYCEIIKAVNSSSTYNPSTGTGQLNMDGCFRTTANQENNLPGMCYTNYIIEHMKATFVGNQAMPQYTYLEFNNSMLNNTAYNGNLFTYYYKGDFYSNNQIKLGEIIPNDSYYFEVRLKDSKTEVIKGTSFVALNTTPYTFYNDSAIYINEDFEVYAIPRLLNYSTQYQLEIISYYGDGNNNLYEDIDWFIFLPENATISGDVITSLGSGDFTNQNATNQIIDNQNQNNNEIIQSINNIVGNLPAVLSGDNSGDASGDLSSGFDGGGGILGGIFSLFVPDGQFFKDYFEDLNNWFSDRLGLLYFPIELTIDFLTRCLNIDFTSQVLSVGPYVLPLNDNFELVPEIEIDFNSFLEDETVNSIHEVYLFITDGLIIFGLYRLIIKKYNNIVKNKGGG